MSSNRKVVFANGEYYHIYNRGVEKRPTFTSKIEFQRAVNSLNYYRNSNLSLRYSKYLALDREKRTTFIKSLDESKPQVAIVAYCFMDNHFHILLKQLEENGIVSCIAKFTNSYTKYFNTKHKRVGPLFQGVFKAVHIEDNEQLIHLSRYIHLNPVIGFKLNLEGLGNYSWSSYPEYVGLVNNGMVKKDEILHFFKNAADYKQFVVDRGDYLRKLNKVEHLILEKEEVPT